MAVSSREVTALASFVGIGDGTTDLDRLLEGLKAQEEMISSLPAWELSDTRLSSPMPSAESKAVVHQAQPTVSEQVALLGDRSMSSVELVESVLERLYSTEPHLHAYVCERSEAALEEAREADQRRGRKQPLSPVDGVPFAVKDVIATSDLSTEAGSRLLKGHQPRHDAAAVSRLREAGAILLGKHQTHEFAMGQNFPPTRNPWNLDHYPGGSSAGGGVSVAVGSALFALGTDAGGSVRKPAALTGTVGLKPTYGLISTAGVLALASAESLDHVGIITRSVRDTAAIFNLLTMDRSGHRRHSALTPEQHRSAGASGPLRGARIGVERTYFAECSSNIQALFEQALEVLAQLGAEITEVQLPGIETALPAIFPILLSEVGVKHAPLLRNRAAGYDEATRAALQLGAALPAPWISRARKAQQTLQHRLIGIFIEHSIDALASPTVARTSMPLDVMDVTQDLPGLVKFTAPWNLTGQPAISVPCGVTDNGLPAGLQLVGQPWGDDQILQIAAQYQAATEWHNLQPPV